MREKTIQISKSNVIDSLMPLLLATGIVHDGEKITNIHSATKDLLLPEKISLKLTIEKEN